MTVTTGKRNRNKRNILAKMMCDHQGPSNILKEWKDQRKRVKVSGKKTIIFVVAFVCCFVLL